MIEIQKIWLTEDAVWVRSKAGEEACELFSNYPRLRDASKEERENYVTDSIGISWPALDEDLCFDAFFEKKSNTSLYDLFIEHPELNASAIARRLGISQSLFAQYISGTKRPSAIRMNLILNCIHQIGAELTAVRFA